MPLARPFQSLLIANRGEIACRIIRTAQAMGLHTIAVYSEADITARHTRLADESRWIGPPAARNSYLDSERIIEAAKASGADAVHPGYGFLSENAEFADACSNAGLIFVGPSASAIRTMGSKAVAKALMEKAGVPVVPGYHGKSQDLDTFTREAARLGFPVLLKAVAGGGGKGMRIVHDAAALDSAIASAKREAASAFGDEDLLMEKFIERPRHIEVQVFGDTHGNVVSLFERECTLQRRHQKVIEEAPSPSLNDARREILYETARTAAAAIGYVNAGTIEFVADETNAYFIEMNTRLQVEHPTTEMITGLDLVEWQLRVAMGEPLPLRQEEIKMRGHAVEARIYAEDAGKGFLPSSGTITHWLAPRESPALRIDTGVGAGDCIGQYYDPMLAKVIAHWDHRAGALAGLRMALFNFEIAGVATNTAFLANLLEQDAVIHNTVDTGYIERQGLSLAAEVETFSQWNAAAASAATLQGERDATRRDVSDPYSPWTADDGFRFVRHAQRVLKFTVPGGATHSVTLRQSRQGKTLAVNGEMPVAFQFEQDRNDAARYRVTLGGVQRTLTAVSHGKSVTVFDGAKPLVLSWRDPFIPNETSNAVQNGAIAPMPGTILALLAKPGDLLEAGAPMLILEAMKMEHTLRAPAQGRVTKYFFAVGDFVTEGAPLAKFESEEPA